MDPYSTTFRRRIHLWFLSQEGLPLQLEILDPDWLHLNTGGFVGTTLKNTMGGWLKTKWWQIRRQKVAGPVTFFFFLICRQLLHISNQPRYKQINVRSKKKQQQNYNSNLSTVQRKIQCRFCKSKVYCFDIYVWGPVGFRTVLRKILIQ